MQLVIPSPTTEIDFSSAISSPYATAPSTPKAFGNFYYSAPTSPTHVSLFYREFDYDYGSKIDLDGLPKSFRKKDYDDEEDDFVFDVKEELDRASLSADELFDGGKIRPLKPPLQLQIDEITASNSSLPSPRSPVSKGKTIVQTLFSPRMKKTEHERGRVENRDLQSSRSRRERSARSLSPNRVSAYPWESEEQQQNNSKLSSISEAVPSSAPTTNNYSSKCSKRWRLMDFFLFRSASEGRATDKDRFRKQDDAKTASFRTVEGTGSRRKGRVSAHEMHYTVNKAVSEDMKKRTFLPYKQGILGRLAFNPAVHALSTGFGSLSRT